MRWYLILLVLPLLFTQSIQAQELFPDVGDQAIKIPWVPPLPPAPFPPGVIPMPMPPKPVDEAPMPRAVKNTAPDILVLQSPFPETYLVITSDSGLENYTLVDRNGNIISGPFSEAE